MRALTGICATGMTSQMLQTKMKLNIVSRNGVQHRPSSPIVSRMMPLRTKSIVDSATFCAPRRHELRPAAGGEEEHEHDNDRAPHLEDDLVHAERSRRRR